MAHNQETGRYRGVSEQQRADFLDALNKGAGVEEAAGIAGVRTTSLSAVAAHDGELRAALDGLDVAAQRAARMGDYLAALTRTGGSVQQALALTRMTKKALERYRAEEPAFREVERAVKSWITSASASAKRQGSKVSDARLAQAAELMEQGMSVSAAARAVKCSPTGLRHAARRDARLAAAIKQAAATWTGAGRPAQVLDAGRERLLRKLWAEPSCSQKTVAERMQVSPATLSRWVDELQLPRQRAGRRYEAFGGTYTARELGRLPQCVVGWRSVYERLARGWSAEEAVTTPPGHVRSSAP